MTSMEQIDILAIAAHRDDVELTCAGIMIKARKQGKRTGIIDLTAGETGTRGSAELRGEEAAKAAAVMGISVRQNMGLPDAGVVNTPETRNALAVMIRKLKPSIVVAPCLQGGRHPDHRIAAQLVRDACFAAKLARVAPDVPPHKVKKIIHSTAYREDHVKPTFVVDISDEFETKMEAIMCYQSQFDGLVEAGELYPTGDPLYELIRIQSSHYGSLIRARYGEPYFTTETVRIDDINTLEVAAF